MQFRKLVLYSNQILPDCAPVDARLFALLGSPHPRIGYVPSRSDPMRKYFRECQAHYARGGGELSVYFELDADYHPDLLDDLLACDAIHLSGGDTFYFLHWLRTRHLLATLREYVAGGGVLIGVSAGSILMTPDISSARLCGDVPSDEGGDETALGLVDFAFVPHRDARNPDLAPLKRLSRHARTVVYGCADSGGIIVNGDAVECIGEVVCIDESGIQDMV